MLVKTFGSAVYGVDAITITIEVSVTNGLHTFVVGLADNTVKESIQRVESAIKSNGYHMPRTKLVINLAPADIRKTGSAFDLPIALGVLGATEQIGGYDRLNRYVMMGELGLDGSIHTIRGTLPIAIQAQRERFKGLIIPRRNAREAAIVRQLNIFPVSHIREVIDLFSAQSPAIPAAMSPAQDGVPEREAFLSIHSIAADNGPISVSTQGSPTLPASHTSVLRLNASSLPYVLPAQEKPLATQPELDFNDVRGQESIKRALEIAAAGGHNTILIGPPGAGKTMLAQRLPGILPPLSMAEALETTKIYSIAGQLPEQGTLITQRPFRSPHHTLSPTALVGGGSIPQPGEISLAHNGVLFLDELPEFKRSVLEVMRQPMEDGKVTISRARMSIDFPARFILLASMNPCPCGYYNHPDKACTCPSGAVQKYLNKISGPMLDRIDLHVEVVPVSYSTLSDQQHVESSSDILQRVLSARELQARRYPGIFCNARMNSRMVSNICRIDAAGQKLLQAAMTRLHLSARAYDRILKVSRTIADLDGSESISPEHLAEAIQFRSLDRAGWAG